MTITLPKMTKEQIQLVEQYKYIAWSRGFRKYFDNQFPYSSKEDIYQFLLYGLCIASIKYDKSKGYKFITYAYKTMYQLCKRQINQDRWLICNPRRCADNDCLSDIAEYRNSFIEPEIFNDIFPDDNNSIEVVNKSYDTLVLLQRLDNVLNTLPEADRKLVELRYFSGDKVMSYKSMEAYTGLTARTMCNRISKIIKVLKKRMSN